MKGRIAGQVEIERVSLRDREMQGATDAERMAALRQGREHQVVAVGDRGARAATIRLAFHGAFPFMVWRGAPWVVAGWIKKFFLSALCRQRMPAQGFSSGSASLLHGQVISDIQAPPTATSGQTVTISWKVTNIGPGKTLLHQSWEDGIYFALDTVPNVNLGNPFPFPSSWSQLTAAGRPLLLGRKDRPAALDSGQFYTNSINFTLPLGYNFPVYVYGIAANNGAIYRLLQASNLNDTARAPNQIAITQPPVPDLRVDSVFTPASIFSGSTMNITYKVKNYGVVTPAGGT